MLGSSIISTFWRPSGEVTEDLPSRHEQHLEAAVSGARDIDMALSTAKIRNLSEVGDRQLN